MKKLNSLAAAALMAAVIACGCTGCTDNDSNNSTSNNANNNANNNASSAPEQQEQQPESNDENVDLGAYKKPADAVSIDLTKDDPSNDDIRFVIEDGKVTQCYYNIGEQQVFASYSYKEDGTVEIYAFMGEILVADDIVEIPNEISEESFMEIDGYYFKTDGLKI